MTADIATFDRWKEQSRRGDWHLTFVGSDIRQMLGEIERLRATLEDARHYAAVCPPPPELTGEARIEMLERRHRIGMAGAHEQRADTNG